MDLLGENFLLSIGFCVASLHNLLFRFDPRYNEMRLFMNYSRNSKSFNFNTFRYKKNGDNGFHNFLFPLAELQRLTCLFRFIEPFSWNTKNIKFI